MDTQTRSLPGRVRLLAGAGAAALTLTASLATPLNPSPRAGTGGR
jgi:peptide/nickel transport system substrate-binding protein